MKPQCFEKHVTILTFAQYTLPYRVKSCNMIFSVHQNKLHKKLINIVQVSKTWNYDLYTTMTASWYPSPRGMATNINVNRCNIVLQEYILELNNFTPKILIGITLLNICIIGSVRLSSSILMCNYTCLITNRT